VRFVPSLTVLSLVLGLGLAPAPARAQDLIARAQLEVDRTDQRIRLAQAVPGITDNAEARAALDRAGAVQAQAKAELAALHPRIAADLTLRARALADQAVAIVRGLPDPDLIRAQVERTREVLERARDRLDGCDSDRARALVRVAFAMQDRAEQALPADHYLAALQLTMSARERMMRALRLCRMEENVQDAADRALQRTDDVLARAHDLIATHPTPDARQALERALGMQASARQEFRATHWDATLRLTLSARAFAFRAVRLSGS
jgi:hypothetical protein